jgi:hypothetical protein
LAGKVLRIAALLIAAGFCAYKIVDIYPWILDDAFISFRYAENMAAGHGLVYNPGEPVEGYTTFLWVFLLGIGKAIGFELVLLSRALGSVFALGCLLLVAFADRGVSLLNHRQAIVAVLFLGTCGAFSPWAISGMEVTLFMLLVTAAVLLYLRAQRTENSNRGLALTGLACALAALTRPEGLIVFGVIFLNQLYDSLTRKNAGVIYLAVAFLAGYVPYFVWRYAYYGYLLPNTFYAKVGSTAAQIVRGGEYALKFALAALNLLLLAFLPLLLRRWWRQHAELRILPMMILVFAAYTIVVGGDCMPAYRFFAPVLPLLCLQAAVSLTMLWDRKVLFYPLLVAALAYSVYMAHTDYQMSGLLHRDYIAWRGKEVGLWLKYNVDPDAVVATNTAGSVPYFSELRAVDMLGMNDSHIAHCRIEDMGSGFVGHEKGDGEYVLSRRPDIIIFGSAEGSETPAFRSDRELYEMPEFHRLYDYKVYRLPSGRALRFYQLRGSAL